MQPKEVLLAYEVSERQTFDWLIQDGKVIKTMTIPISRKELTEQVKKHRGFFEGINSYPQLSRFDPLMGKELYNMLFQDFVPYLNKEEQIIIVPDEILGVLPFEALVVKLPAQVKMLTGNYGPYYRGVGYLGDLYAISYYQSATAFALARTLKAAGGAKTEKMLVVADPVFELSDARLTGKKAC